MQKLVKDASLENSVIFNLDWRSTLNSTKLRISLSCLSLCVVGAAHAVLFSDVTVTTTTGTYTSPLTPGDSTGEGYIFIPDQDNPEGDGIEVESVDDIIGQGSESEVSYSYTVTADPGEVIYGADITPGMYLYDADGLISNNFGPVSSNNFYFDDGFNNGGAGTSVSNYHVSLGHGLTSFTVTGQYDMSTIGSQNPFAEGYADHLETTFTESSTPGPAGVLPFAAGLLLTAFRRRVK